MKKEAALKKELYLEIGYEMEAVLSRAEDGAGAILQDARAQREALLAEGREEIGRQTERRKARALVRARNEMRNRILEERRREIDRLLRAALEKISAMAREERETYGDLLWSFFRAGKELMPPGPLRVRLGEAPEAVRGRIEGVGEVEVEEAEGWYGLQIETLDGRLRCDYRLPNLLQRNRRDREAEIEEILFEVRGEP